MTDWLLFYDTKERDLARDLQDFLKEIGLETKMIPRSPDRGTLEEKEAHYIENAAGAIFLLTAGADRDGKSYPSPSVTDEMGQSKQRFKENRNRIIYLVEKGCAIQAIDQQTYIEFEGTKVRSVLDALTQLVRDLKAVDALNRSAIRPRETPGVNIAEVAVKTSDILKRICSWFSTRPNGCTTYIDFQNFLKGPEMNLVEQDANFAKRDVQVLGFITFVKGEPPANTGWWTLTPLGWELARYDKEQREKAMEPIFRALALSKGPSSTFGKVFGDLAKDRPKK